MPTAGTIDNKAVHFQRCESVKRLLHLVELLHEESHYEAMVSIISVIMDYNLDFQI